MADTDASSEERGAESLRDEDTSNGESRTRLDRRGILRLTAAGAATAALGAAGSSNVSAQADTVTILHDTHTHSEIGDVGGDANIARYVSKIDELMSSESNPMFLGNGDDLGPSIYSLFTEGEHIIDFLNEGYQMTANAVGNHEFDYGPENKAEQFERSDFTWVSADLLGPDGEAMPNTERWILEERNGIDVGIFGLAPDDIRGVTSFPDDWINMDKIEAAQEATDALVDEGADVIVCTSHTDSPVHYDLAEEVDGLDAIVGSHWGIVMDEPDVVDGTVISEVGDEFDHIGAVELDADGNLVDWERHDATDADEDSGIVSMMEDLEEQLDEELGTVVGRTEYELDTDRTYIESRDTRMGNVGCDMMIDFFDDAEIALFNEGGFRGGQSYGPGEMTARDWTEVFAFGNTLVMLEVDGETLLETLRWRGVPSAEGQHGRPDQNVGGIQYEWNPHDADMDYDHDYDEEVHAGGMIDVDNVYVNGEPLETDETYMLATNNWVAANDGGYVPLHGIDPVSESDVTLAVAMNDYFEDRGVVAPEVGYRMVRVDEDVGEHTDVLEDDGTVTLVFDAPETGTDVYPDTYRAITEYEQDAVAETARMDGDELHVTFVREHLETLSSGPESVDLRVIGGFAPDEEQFEYDTPGTEAWSYHVVKGSVDASAFDTTDVSEPGSDDGDDGNGGSDNGNADSGDEETPVEEDTSDDSVPGFGVVTGAAGVGAGAYAYNRLNGDSGEEGDSADRE